MEFSRQEHWSELQFPSPGDLPNAGIEPQVGIKAGSPALRAEPLPTEPSGRPLHYLLCTMFLRASMLLCNTSDPTPSTCCIQAMVCPITIQVQGSG